ncbi:hypothetical protein FA13DRAFT_39155 [Coprinellus micaceus]|uniref:Uncharacterized protein n=1 Tax=Coprinellus micaceus TaxID=71717 RepID=A0A4Y7U0Z3_COPMI|nr:hypothetical protein FA13DRAFT_39155 [Coprinellus micaceus]
MLAPSVLRFGSHYYPSFARGLACALQVLWLLFPGRSLHLFSWSPVLLRRPFYLNFLPCCTCRFFFLSLYLSISLRVSIFTSPLLSDPLHARPIIFATSLSERISLSSKLKEWYPTDYSCYD